VAVSLPPSGFGDGALAVPRLDVPVGRIGGEATPRRPRASAGGTCTPPVDLYDDDGGGADDARGLSAPKPRRVLASERAGSLEEQIQAAIIPRLRGAVGWPSSSAFGKDPARVTATIIGQSASRSRAVVLRYGAQQNAAAILWVSARGGLLCSCFGGTQDAMLLSTSSRTTDCMHTKIFIKAMEAGDVSTSALRTRIALRANAADFSVPRVVGSTLVMCVLWRKFFSAVMFTSKKATCIAPGFRSFARRCGHVRVALQDREGLEPEEGGAGMTIYVPGTAKVKRDKSARPRFFTSEEEDVGL